MDARTDGDATAMERRLGARVSAYALVATACAACALVASCHATGAPNSERICSGAQAISESNLLGGSLPAKTLALTFDDGPGARTAELSSYLKSQGIRAGFFVNGKMVDPSSTVLAQLVADGHVVGNHTQTHASLTGRSTGTAHLGDADTVSELTQTDAIIAAVVPASRFMFRAPYGDYDLVSAHAINASAMSKYVGPIQWDIGDHMGAHQAADWDCWRAGNDGLVLTVPRCAQLYLEEIESVGRGVILMHDPYFLDGDPAHGGTVDMVQLLVPTLKTLGYSFARVDEIPEIAALLPALPAPGSGTSSSGSAGSSGSASSSGGASSSGAGGSLSDRPPVTKTGTSTESSPAVPPPHVGSAGGVKPDPCPPSPQPNDAR